MIWLTWFFNPFTNHNLFIVKQQPYFIMKKLRKSRGGVGFFLRDTPIAIITNAGLDDEGFICLFCEDKISTFSIEHEFIVHFAEEHAKSIWEIKKKALS